MMDISQMEEKGKHFTKRIMDVCYKTQCGHPSSAMSCIDIMTVLFYGDILKFDPAYPVDPDRDRFILSKGHAGIGLYVILEDLGLIDSKMLYTYCCKNSILGGHLNRLLVPGTEFSAGSLGHGLAYGIGQAMNLKFKGIDRNVYVLLGDGECQEGSVWESALCAGNKKLDNLTVIVDNNNLQASEYTDNISSLKPFKEKWDTFGFDSIEINGHSYIEIRQALLSENITRKPRAIIANTIKGHGVSMMASKNHWHSRRPNKEEWKEVSMELGLTEMEDAI